MSLKSSDDLLLLPEQKLTGKVGNLCHRYLPYWPLFSRPFLTGPMHKNRIIVEQI